MLDDTPPQDNLPQDLTADPALEKYAVTYPAGEVLFLEGDESEDLYILISGRLDVLKGDKSISEVSTPGAPFGEISFLRGKARTATVQARTPVKAIRIPGEEIGRFLQEFPALAWQITKILAGRLDCTSQALYGFKELCDQMPDAVTVTDREGRILSWNKAAEELYGRSREEMRDAPMAAVYSEPQAYRDLLEAVHAGEPVREKVLKVSPPGRGCRLVSTSSTMLHDGHFNFQGIMSLGRDVTEMLRSEQRYRKARYWLAPLLMLVVLSGGAAVFSYRHFSGTALVLDVKQQGLKEQLTRDYLLLTALLHEPLAAGDRQKTTEVLRDFLEIGEKTKNPCDGLLVLDRDRRVFAAFVPRLAEAGLETVGSSYGGISFQGNDKSPHRVLTVYRSTRKEPMGSKGLELAFPLPGGPGPGSWLLFQMDGSRLVREFNLDDETLKRMRFDLPAETVSAGPATR